MSTPWARELARLLVTAQLAIPKEKAAGTDIPTATAVPRMVAQRSKRRNTADDRPDAA